MEWLGLVLGALGLVPTAVLAREHLRDRLPLRRALGFASPRGIEFLVTTSASGISSVGPADGPRARRALVPSGDLAGLAELSGLMSRVYPRRDVVITPSAYQQEDRRRDQVVVGGPVHNRYASQLICGDMTSASEDATVVFDADRRYVKVGSIKLGPDLDLAFEDEIPQIEYALVLLTSVHRFGRDQRVVVVAGMTTYGTHAGAHFVCHGLAPYRRSASLGPRPNVAILVKAAIANGQPYDVRAVTHAAIERVGSWR